jgi:hypothetical protein
MSDVITEIWFENVDGHSDAVLKFRDVPKFKGMDYRSPSKVNEQHERVRVPLKGEHVAWRGAEVGCGDAPELEEVVDIRTYIYQGEDNVWVEEIHVMTSARP